MGRSGSTFLLSFRFLYASCVAHCFFSLDNSDSARLSSSRISSTRRSCAAIAVIKSFGSVGDVTNGVSRGVGGNEVAVVDAGVGREGYAVGGAIGSVSESRLVLRDAVDPDRVDRVSRSSFLEGDGDGGTESDCKPLASAVSPPQPSRAMGCGAGTRTGEVAGEGAGRNIASSMLFCSGMGSI